jgi:hypothetical protein
MLNQPEMPTRQEIEEVWTRLEAGSLDRQSAHEWAVPWVEEFDHLINDPMVLSAVQTLHGFIMRKQVGSNRSAEKYLFSDADIAIEHRAWKADCETYDKNPGAWRAAQLEVAFRMEPSLRLRFGDSHNTSQQSVDRSTSHND